jgi:hypothetical protein
MYIPDALKPDVVKFFDSPAGKALFIALEQRRLAAPGMTPKAHQMLQAYAQREGFDLCIEALRKLPFESGPEETAGKTDPLTDPKD